jgi:hypothetical protein
MDSKQKYYPHFGYTAPRRTKKACENPAFADENLHRIGIFAIEFHGDGASGYVCIRKCVNCGRIFNYAKGVKRTFIVSKHRADIVLS